MQLLSFDETPYALLVDSLLEPLLGGLLPADHCYILCFWIETWIEMIHAA